jgi:hypothetical protein
MVVILTDQLGKPAPSLAYHVRIRLQQAGHFFDMLQGVLWCFQRNPIIRMQMTTRDYVSSAMRLRYFS